MGSDGGCGGRDVEADDVGDFGVDQLIKGLMEDSVYSSLVRSSTDAGALTLTLVLVLCSLLLPPCI